MATSFTTHSAGQVITSADVNLIQTAVNTLENAVVGVPGVWTPANSGFTAWNMDLMAAETSVTPVTTTVYAGLLVVTAGTITNLHCGVRTLGSPTNFLMALYNSSGTLLSSSANIAANGTSAGTKTFPLGAAQVVTAGFYYAVIWFSGGGAPALVAHTNNSATPNAGLSNATRFATSGTAATTAAPSPLGTLTAAANPIWLACS